MTGHQSLIALNFIHMDEIALAVIAIDEPIPLGLDETGHHAFDAASCDILLRQNEHPFKSDNGDSTDHVRTQRQFPWIQLCSLDLIKASKFGMTLASK